MRKERERARDKKIKLYPLEEAKKNLSVWESERYKTDNNTETE